MSTAIYGNGTTTATGGANTITHYYDRAGIKAANAVNVYGQFTDRKSMPQKMGKTFKISKWQHIYDLDQTDGDFAAKGFLGKRTLDSVTTNLANSGSTGALAEGSGAVNKVQPKKITFETSLNRYGFMTEYTDEVVLFSEDAVQVKYREELGYLVNQATEDLLQRDMLTSAGIVINAGGDITMDQIGSTVDAADTNAEIYKVSFDTVRKGVKALVRNRAQKHTEIVTGSTKIGTKPVNKAFYAIVGPEVKYDLESLTRGTGYATEYAYIPAYQYAAAANLAEGEIGSMHDVRFIESEGAVVEAAGGSIIPVSYAGELSYTDLSGELRRYLNGTADDITITVNGVDMVVEGTDTIAGGGIVTLADTDVVTGEGALTLDNTNARFDVYPILIPTKGAFATVGLKGKGKVTFHSKAPSDVSLSNPYGTKGFFSANMFYASIALKSEAMARINVLASA